MTSPLKYPLLSGLFLLFTCVGQAQMQSDKRWRGCKGEVFGVDDARQPFSAIRNMEDSNIRDDGSRAFNQKIQMRLYRDTEGRTRQDYFMPKRPGDAQDPIEHDPVTIEIFDPVIGARYTLDATKRVATRCVLTLEPPRQTRPSGSGSAGATTPRASQASSAVSPAGAAQWKETIPLGTQLMEGVLATGQRTITHVPVHATGVSPPNEIPFEIVEEGWFSPDLKQRMFVKRTDSHRHHESVESLTHIDRSEPDITLFQIPAGYAIQDQTPAQAPR